MSEGGFIIPIPGVTWAGWAQVDTLEEAYQILRARRKHGPMIGHTSLKIEGEDDSD